MMIKSINPTTNLILQEYETFSDEKVISIINLLSQDYLDWRDTTFETRKNILISIADILKGEVEKHSKMITLEIGKPISESRAEVLKCVWAIKYFAENSENFLKNEHIKTDYKESYIQYDPLGIIFGIMPWNFPYWQVFRFISPALMAGNVCLLKHASNVTGCSLLIEDIILRASNQKNIYKSILINSSQVENEIKNSNIKAVSLTGSLLEFP